MKKQEFLDRLSEHLTDVPKPEKAKLIEYYNELYYDRLEGGEAEEDIVAGFGAPSFVAERFLSEGGYVGEIINKSYNTHNTYVYNNYNKADYNKADDKPQNSPQENNGGGDEEFSAAKGGKKDGFKADNADNAYKADKADNAYKADKYEATKPFYKNKTFWTVYFAGFIITFPLTIAAFGLCIGLLGGALGLFVGLIVGGLGLCIGLASCIFAGLYGIASSVAMMFTSLPIGLVQLGLSFAALSAGLVGIYLCIKLYGLLARLTKRLLNRRKNHGK